MADILFQFELRDEGTTESLAQQIAPRLKKGDTLLLEGPIGAGKSAFARALIRTRLDRMEDVPSPTFTLVQTYEHDAGDIWHCDLYRLTHPDEALELGLEEAFETAICLIEWPDRLGSDAPNSALFLKFSAHTNHHEIAISGTPSWQDRLKDLHV